MNDRRSRIWRIASGGWVVGTGMWLAVYALAESKQLLRLFRDGIFSSRDLLWCLETTSIALLPVAVLVPLPWFVRLILKKHRNAFVRTVVYIVFAVLVTCCVLMRMSDTYESVYRSFVFRDLSLQELVAQYRTDRAAQKQHPVEEGKTKHLASARGCSRCGRSANNLEWVWHSSAWFTWKHLMGSAGWMTICTDCNEQVEFFMEWMN